jgi:hypothetical protein
MVNAISSDIQGYYFKIPVPLYILTATKSQSKLLNCLKILSFVNIENKIYMQIANGGYKNLPYSK